MKGHDEGRLPVWAQRELSRLRADLAAAHVKLDAVAVGGDGTVLVDDHGAELGLEMRPVATRRVVFLVPGPPPWRRKGANPVRGRVEINVKDRRLRVSCWEDALAVRPTASNTVEIELVKP